MFCPITTLATLVLTGNNELPFEKNKIKCYIPEICGKGKKKLDVGSSISFGLKCRFPLQLDKPWLQFHKKNQAVPRTEQQLNCCPGMEQGEEASGH